jgi:hypothetical protein
MREFVKINEAAKKEAEEAGQPFDDTQTPKMSYYKARQVSYFLIEFAICAFGPDLVCNVR